MNGFADSAKIFIKAGDGGDGIVSFHKEKYVPNGGPDGGDGGNGGNIIFKVDEGVRTLWDFRYKKHYKAEAGKKGGDCNCNGRSGKDLIIKVPVGTMIKNEETGQKIADLTKPGQEIVAAKGGKGGAGNQHFATPTRQAPNFAKAGDEGEEFWVLLELKLLADVGLIGYPNVGKSTILSMVSAAKPKIANYPFTTIVPNLGVVKLYGGEGFVLADIPGIIEGAHNGVGLGHDFLKHIERTKILIHIIDMASVDGRDPVQDFEVVNRELNNFNSILSARPQVVVANKMDIPGTEIALQKLASILEPKGYKVFPVSAATNKGLSELMTYVGKKLREIPDDTSQEQTEETVLYTLPSTTQHHFDVHKENNTFIIEGKWIKKIIRSINFDDERSVKYFQRMMKAKGVNAKLEEMGVKEGDIVKIYQMEFEYVK